VSKTYLCVVIGPTLASMERASQRVGPPRARRYGLSGYLRKPDHGGGSCRGTKNRSRSVAVTPARPDAAPRAPDGGRLCHLEWRHLTAVDDALSAAARRGSAAPPPRSCHLVAVTTSTGARHQVRAMLARLCAGAAVAGDLRYGDDAALAPLPDASVALHARSIHMPTVAIGTTDTSAPFVAPVPRLWGDLFGLYEEDVMAMERRAG